MCSIVYSYVVYRTLKSKCTLLAPVAKIGTVIQCRWQKRLLQLLSFLAQPRHLGRGVQPPNNWVRSKSWVNQRSPCVFLKVRINKNALLSILCTGLTFFWRKIAIYYSILPLVFFFQFLNKSYRNETGTVHFSQGHRQFCLLAHLANFKPKKNI